LLSDQQHGGEDCDRYHELTITVRRDEFGMSQASRRVTSTRSLRMMKAPWCQLADDNHAFARHIGFALAKPDQPLDLLRFQHGKHQIAAGRDQVMNGLRPRSRQGECWRRAELAAQPRSIIAAREI